MATTLRSIDVVRACPVCGPVDDITEIGKKWYCSACLAEALTDRLMVPEVGMISVENVVDDTANYYACPFCALMRKKDDGACPNCGKQDIDVDGHYLCTACGKLTRNGRSCDHCGVG